MTRDEQIKKLVGREYSELNCWDLVVQFYRNVMGEELRHLYDGRDLGRRENEKLIWANKGEFDRVVCPQFGDLVVFKLHGFETHIGVYLQDTKFIHSTKTMGSCIDSVDRWKPYIVGFFRLKQKAP